MIEYTSEQSMSRDFEKYLKSLMGTTYYKELKGLFGVPDFVCFEKQEGEIRVISFELKLTNWKHAMVQAFRYKSFSHLSYVVMPENEIQPACHHSKEFEQYGIGLLSFGPTGLHTICTPSPSIPYSPQLSEKVINKVKRSRKKSIACVTDMLMA